MADRHMSTSELRNKTLAFDWIVKDFKTAISFSQQLQSTTFSFTIERCLVGSWLSGEPLPGYGSATVSFELKITKSRERLTVELYLTDTEKNTVVAQGKQYRVYSLNVKFRVSLVRNEEGAKVFSKETVGMLQSRIFIHFEKVYEQLADGDLKVHCDLTVYGKMMTHTPIRFKPTYNHRMSSFNLGPQMEKLRKEESFTDFTLVVGGKKFQVHKVVLAAHSPVFKRMFETNMREKRESCSSLDDVTPDIVEKLLTCMYTGEMPNLEEELAMELFQVADKYQIAHLKALCEAALCDNLTVDNAVDRILLADTHSASRLRSFCKEFIEDHISEVKETQEWCRLKERQQLYIDVLEAQLPPSKKKKL